MKRWQRRLFGILALGGGATGFTVAAQTLFGHARGINILLLLVVMAIYAWGVWCGLMLLEGQPGVERLNRRYWLLQIPILSSPFLSGHLWGGASAIATLNFWPMDASIHAAFGASFNFSLLQRSDGVALGVNLFAFVVATWLQHIRHLERTRAAVDAAPAETAAAEPAATPDGPVAAHAEPATIDQQP